MITRRWRLIGGTELYDIRADPGQQHDLAGRHPDVVEHLRAAHERWWAEIRPALDEHCPISLGNGAENPTRLTAMDVLGDVAWHQVHVLMAQKSTGRWAVDVEREGTYRFSLRRWPEELDLPIDADCGPAELQRHISYRPDAVCRTLSPTAARLKLFGRVQTAGVDPGAKETTFHVRVDRTGATELEAWFADDAGESQGAYYVYVERVPTGRGSPT